MDVKLVMFKSNGQRKNFPLEGNTLVIGRGQDCGLRIPLLSVSRRHAQLSIQGEGLYVKDLGSSNGTYIDNQRIADDQAVEAGCRLAIGPVVFTLQIDGQPEQIKEVKTRGQKQAEAKRAQKEEVIDLEADIDAAVSFPDEDADIDPGATFAMAGDDDDIDPIAALEALANEEDDDDL